MKRNILLEISNFCETCSSHENCPEEECVLYRIEKLLLKGVKNVGRKNK